MLCANLHPGNRSFFMARPATKTEASDKQNIKGKVKVLVRIHSET